MELKYDKNGLIVAIAQDAITGKVLMQAYMNKEAFEKTLESGYATYYSRSRQKLWVKGEESGNTQQVMDVAYDCDEDSILLQVIQKGVACHTGNYSCFYRSYKEFSKFPDYKIIFDIVKTIEERRANPKQGSYTNYLLDKGTNKVCKKIGEESSEVIIAAVSDDKHETIMEISDLVYHILVLMNIKNISVTDVYYELMKREGNAPDPKYLTKN